MNFSNIIKNINNWEQLKNDLSACDNKTKGDVFEQITKYYLLWKPEFASKLKNIWLGRDVPTKIQKKLNLPSNDQGIDLIAETIEGEFWSVQCKYITDENTSISHGKISTFISLSFGIATGIKFGLVCTTVDDYAHLYRGKENIGFVLSDEWNKLGTSFFDFVRAMVSNKKIIFKPALQPRDHQQRAIENAVTHFVKEKNNRGKLVFPCGAGKSLTGYWISQRLKTKSLIVAVPSLALVKQTLEVYLEQTVANDENVRWLCVCSDEGIGKNDDVAVYTQDIGIPCVTDTITISNWLSANRSHKTIVFTTYQSGKTIAEAARKTEHIFDLGIMDEAHKTVGANDKLFSYLLYDNNIKIKRRIFMTATERRYRGSSDDIVSMDDLDLFGETFEHMSFAHAVEANILSDYKIVTLAVSNQDIIEAVKDNALIKDGIDARSYAALIALRKAMQKYPIHHAVSFHGSIAKAKAFKVNQDVFTNEHPEFLPVDVFHVSGATPTAARSKEIGEFAKSDRSLITNAKCLTEGVDVPGIDAVLFADPRKSTVDIVQAVGRTLRKSPGKTSGYVILPLFTGDATGEAILESDDFKEIIATLRALASNDERIIEYFRDISKGKKSDGKLIEFNIDVTAQVNFDADDFVRELELRTWDRLAKLSWRSFEEAREFVRSLGLRSVIEWVEYSKSEKRPFDIPATPNTTYVADGWSNWGNWLGTGKIATSKRQYRTFEEAMKFVRSLRLKSNVEWKIYSKSNRKPDDIPANPSQTYAELGWKGIGDWLGTGNIAPRFWQFRSFEEARKFVHSLKLKGESEWRLYSKSDKKPKDIPANPSKTYAEDGWESVGDWLGTGIIATFNRKYRPFSEAKKFVQSLKLKGGEDWLDYCKSGKKPDDIPTNPSKTYAEDGWNGIGDWLGTGTIATLNRSYRKFTEARKFVHSLNMKSEIEWRSYCRSGKKPDDIPAGPSRVYANDGWQGVGDWLGTGRIADQQKEYRSFMDARSFARELGLVSRAEWIAYSKSGNKPADIPSKPDNTYAHNGWEGMGDWLVTRTISVRLREYRSFHDARKFVQSLGLKNQSEWRSYCKSGKNPDDIPTNPSKTYAENGWTGLSDWLGTDTIAARFRQYRTFSEVRKFVHSLKLKSAFEWRIYCKSGKKPSDIPSNLEKKYKTEWRGWPDFLGTKKKESQ